jgi:hypothetical protein
VSEASQAHGVEVGLYQAVTLPEVLDAGFDAFEAIRITARACQDQVPGLFAAFMTAADVAVDGREALITAPSLPRRRGTLCGGGASAEANAGQAADVLAELAAVLRERLAAAAEQANLPGDQVACRDAASAAARICQLMTR